MPQGLSTPIEITPVAIGSWETVDLSAQLAPHAGQVSGIILYIENISPILYWADAYGARRTGSSDTTLGWMWIDVALHQFVGIDNLNQLDLYRIDGNIKFWLKGFYTNDEAVFFTEPITHNNLVPGVWETHSIAAYTGADTPILAFVRVWEKLLPSDETAFRAVGATAIDAAKMTGALGVPVKVDAAQEFEAYVDNILFDIQIMGYQKLGATMFIDKIDYQTATVDSYVSVDYSVNVPASSNGVYYHLTNTQTDFIRIGAHRALGSGWDHWRGCDKQMWGWDLIDSNRFAQQKINNSELDLFLLGYTTAPPSTKLPFAGRAIHGGFHQFDGGLS